MFDRVSRIKQQLRRIHRDSQRELIKRIGNQTSGVDVMTEDWDNLIILDACRYDTFSKYVEIPGDLSKMISKGETTRRFIEENFQGRKFYDTVYVCGNAQVGGLIDIVDVYKFLGLWTDKKLPDFDRSYRDIVPPELMVTETLKIHDRHPDKRVISHFLQPHPPFVVKDGEPISPGSKYRDFTAARNGEISQEEIVKVYEENVRYVLSYVEELIEGLTGKTVVTADHGELLGEGVPRIYDFIHPRWTYRNRRRFDYAHYDYVRVPELVEVPWLEIDNGPRRDISEATSSAGIEMNEKIVEDRLKALGYR